MARPGSQQVAGYFPSPERLLPSIASVLRWPKPSGPTFLLDPCAGDGSAIRTLRRLWVSTYCPDPLTEAGMGYYDRMSIVGCELEAERAATLKAGLNSFGDVAFHGDAFRLSALEPRDRQATVLYLNPPYDHDAEYRRLEHRFLLRFAEHLHPGCGLLLFLVPHYALAPSAEFLARNFLDIRAWRLPEPEFWSFKQVLLVGRRARRPLTSSHPSWRGPFSRWAAGSLLPPGSSRPVPGPLRVNRSDDDAPFSLCLRARPP